MASAGNRLALFGYAGINVPVFFGPPSPDSWNHQAQQARSSELQPSSTQVPPASKTATNLSKRVKTFQWFSKAIRIFQKLSIKKSIRFDQYLSDIVMMGRHGICWTWTSLDFWPAFTWPVAWAVVFAAVPSWSGGAVDGAGSALIVAAGASCRDMQGL